MILPFLFSSFVCFKQTVFVCPDNEQKHLTRGAFFLTQYYNNLVEKQLCYSNMLRSFLIEAVAIPTTLSAPP